MSNLCEFSCRKDVALGPQYHKAENHNIKAIVCALIIVLLLLLLLSSLSLSSKCPCVVFCICVFLSLFSSRALFVIGLRAVKFAR
jgi:hypothetical protein